jgi:Flp pilus assembly pilin Flp
MLRAFRSDERGVAAVEFALVGGFLMMALLNVAEVSRYAYQSTQVASASQAAAQAVVVKCDTSHVPATINCPDAAAAVTMALQGTSLGANVTLTGGLQEGWYCLSLQGALQRMSDAGSKPANCGAAGNPAAAAGLYVKVNAVYQYQAMFPGLTIAESFSPTIARSAWMRLL